MFWVGDEIVKYTKMTRLFSLINYKVKVKTDWREEGRENVAILMRSLMGRRSLISTARENQVNQTTPDFITSPHQLFINPSLLNTLHILQ